MSVICEDCHLHARCCLMQDPVRRIVMFSGGIGSFAAADRVVRQHGRDITLLFTDTLIEDADLYRFLIESAAFLTGKAGVGEVSGLAARAANTPPSSDMDARRKHLMRLRHDTHQVIPGLAWIADGRTPWEVFRDARMLGNARIARCSHDLKQRTAAEWLERHAPPGSVLCFGIDWMEEHRMDAVRRNYEPKGYTVVAPLCEPPEYVKADAVTRLEQVGIRLPRLYTLGFAHNNCGGGCVRAGIGHFSHLYRALPEVYAEWEQGEQEVREYLGRDDIAILRDRSGGTTKPLTLVQLRRRLDGGEQTDPYDIGGCGCFVDTEAA